MHLLEMLGFDAVNKNSERNDIFSNETKEKIYETEKINLDTKQPLTEETNPIIERKTNTSSNYIADYRTTEITNEFRPTNITEQFKAIWINLEQRRKWVYPAIFILITVLLSSYVVNTYMGKQKEVQFISQEINILTEDLNRLYFTIDEIIEISTNPFFSRYDISNASASLQAIESKLIEYENSYATIEYNFTELPDYTNLQEIKINLDNYMNLINKLDLVLTYRILNTEILTYEELPSVQDNPSISDLTKSLSNVSAVSISNYEQLPSIPEFDRHTKIILQSIEVANQLHGQYLAALRNKESSIANQLILSIGMNKEIVKRSYEKSLNDFNYEINTLYDSIITLP
tara:strand:- start:4423 stop:5460 length:1038 start_codon:yes stop_codon:yes gene_type:complete